jgi:hypothetical protein
VDDCALRHQSTHDGAADTARGAGDHRQSPGERGARNTGQARFDDGSALT